jgi:hypothetical protein
MISAETVAIATKLLKLGVIVVDAVPGKTYGEDLESGFVWLSD